VVGLAFEDFSFIIHFVKFKEGAKRRYKEYRMAMVSPQNFVGIFVNHYRRLGDTKSKLPFVEPVFCFEFKEAFMYGPYITGNNDQREHWNFMAYGVQRKINGKHFRLCTPRVVKDFKHLLVVDNENIQTKRIEFGPGFLYSCVQDRFIADGEYNLVPCPVRIELGTKEDKKIFFHRKGTFAWMKWEKYLAFDQKAYALFEEREIRMAKTRKDCRSGIEDLSEDEPFFEGQKSMIARYKADALASAHWDYFAGMENLITNMLGIDTLRVCGEPCPGIYNCRYIPALMGYVDTSGLGKETCPVKHYAYMKTEDIEELAGCTVCNFRDSKDIDGCMGCKKYNNLLTAREIANKIITDAQNKRQGVGN